MNVFGPEGRETQTKCTRFYRFKAFQVILPIKDLLLSFISIPNINNIDCKIEGSTKAYVFAFLIFSKSSTIGNICVFADFNVDQMEIKKTDP